MVLAFLKDYYEENGEDDCLGKMIMEMCDFYGNKFDPKKEGISFS